MVRGEKGMGKIQRYLVGTYTESILFGTGEIMNGKGKGIHFLELNKETGELSFMETVVEVRNPSFVAVSGNYVYCVNELKEYEGQLGGSVTALSWEQEDGGLQVRQVLPTHGSDPCHVAVDPTGKFLIVSNFMSGSVCCYKIADNGVLTEGDFVQHAGSGVDVKRQNGPHAHSGIWFEMHAEGGRSGREPDLAAVYVRQVLIPDLGKDELVVYQVGVDGELQYQEKVSVGCRAGNGPRYGEFNKEITVLYIVNELSSSVTVLHYQKDENQFSILQEISTLPENVQTTSTAADLHISSDGKNVYASNRGHDSIAVYSVLPDGCLKIEEIVSCKGKTPRNFVIDPEGTYILVANQDSDEIVLFHRDCDTGKLEWRQTISAPTPVCLTPCI